MLSPFTSALQSGRPILLDGAMGTELIRAGLDPTTEATPTWNLTHPGQVLAVHRAYLAAGAEVLLTNTFLLPALAEESNRLAALAAAGVRLARQAADRRVWVLGSVGPGSPAAMVNAARLLRECDAILLETQGDLAATTAAVAALREQQPTVPILVSFSFGHLDGRLQPEAVAAWAGQNRGAVAGLGTNCGRDLTPADLTAVLRRYRRLTALPLLVRPNAGTPTQVDGRWVYPLTPAAFTAEVPAWREIGATLIGGCCGTTAEHVAALRQVL